MAALIYFVFILTVVYGQTLSNVPLEKNTIFLEERLEGQAFEGIYSSDKVTALTDANAWRLPTTTRPNKYNLHMHIDVNNFQFSGTVNIELVATQANVNEIVIHAHDMNINTLELRQGTSLVATTYTRQVEQHFVRIRLTTGTLSYSATTPVLYNLVIGFGSIIRTDMTGLYRSWFRNSHTDAVRYVCLILHNC